MNPGEASGSPSMEVKKISSSGAAWLEKEREKSRMTSRKNYAKNLYKKQIIKLTGGSPYRENPVSVWLGGMVDGRWTIVTQVTPIGSIRGLGKPGKPAEYFPGAIVALGKRKDQEYSAIRQEFFKQERHCFATWEQHSTAKEYPATQWTGTCFSGYVFVDYDTKDSKKDQCWVPAEYVREITQLSRDPKPVDRFSPNSKAVTKKTDLSYIKPEKYHKSATDKEIHSYYKCFTMERMKYLNDMEGGMCDIGFLFTLADQKWNYDWLEQRKKEEKKKEKKKEMKLLGMRLRYHIGQSPLAVSDEDLKELKEEEDEEEEEDKEKKSEKELRITRLRYLMMTSPLSNPKVIPDKYFIENYPLEFNKLKARINWTPPTSPKSPLIELSLTFDILRGNLKGNLGNNVNDALGVCLNADICYISAMTALTLGKEQKEKSDILIKLQPKRMTCKVDGCVTPVHLQFYKDGVCFKHGDKKKKKLCKVCHKNIQARGHGLCNPCFKKVPDDENNKMEGCHLGMCRNCKVRKSKKSGGMCSHCRVL